MWRVIEGAVTLGIVITNLERVRGRDEKKQLAECKN